jgi:NADH-quinone oxidoreductase subunit F
VGLDGELTLLNDIDLAMKDASICGLGHTASTAVLSAIELGLIT